MRFPLTHALIREAEQFALRSSCTHCFFYDKANQRCAHEWPDQGQGRWPLDAPDEAGQQPDMAEFCKEFELR